MLEWVKALVTPITDLIDDLFTSDEERDEAKRRLMLVELEMQIKAQEIEAKIVEAKKDVMVAELQQGDNYTKRARPTVVYAGLVALFLNHILLPWVTFFTGKVLPTIELPTEFWFAWGGVVGVYAFTRGQEKIQASKNK